MNNIMLHICFLEAPKNDLSFNGKQIRKVYSYDLELTGLTMEQAMKLCKELTNHETIAAWLTGGGVEKVDLKE